jgi:hypothetical protein
MSLREPDNTPIEPVIEDSGIHARDTEGAPASLGQMLITGLLVIAILCIFFYGVTEQRQEVSGQQAASSAPPANGTPSQASPTAPSQGKPQSSETTGQGR